MAKRELSIKHLQISKANSTMLIIVGVAAFVVTFSLMASRSLLNKRSFQGDVIAAKETARDNLQTNVKAANDLKTAYQAFVSNQENIIGGSASGKGDRDGDNGRIVLDALPSQYDFPALASSLEKLLSNRGVKVASISGTDDELAQKEKLAENNPTPVEIPFQITISGSYDKIQEVIGILERSIRPIKVKTVSYSASAAEISANISAVTYYQQEKGLKIEMKTFGDAKSGSSITSGVADKANAAADAAAKSAPGSGGASQ